LSAFLSLQINFLRESQSRKDQEEEKEETNNDGIRD